MADLYATLMGEPTSDQERLAALARQLRERQRTGLLGSMMNNPNISKTGAGMVKSADEAAQFIGDQGEQARYRQYQERQAAESLAQRKLEEENAKAQFADEMKYKYAELGSRERDRALTRALAAEKGKKYKPMTMKGIEDLSMKASEAQTFGGVVNKFKDEYATAGAPYTRKLTNTLSAMGLGSDKMDEAQQWWSEYQRGYELPTRNDMFGSALTTQEKKAWAEANINPSMKASQIRKNLAVMDQIKRDALARKKKVLVSAGYDPEAVDAIFEDMVSGRDDTPSAADTPVDDEAEFRDWQAKRRGAR
jgi:hypothetical protein